MFLVPFFCTHLVKLKYLQIFFRTIDKALQEIAEDNFCTTVFVQQVGQCTYQRKHRRKSCHVLCTGKCRSKGSGSSVPSWNSNFQSQFVAWFVTYQEIPINSVNTWFKFLYQVCKDAVDKDVIGGPGVVVKIDESHFCTVKQGQGRNRGKPQNWIFVSDSFTMQAAEKIIYNYPFLPVEIKLIIKLLIKKIVMKKQLQITTLVMQIHN